MSTEQLSSTNWYQIITCISVTITATIAITVFFWGLLPEESKDLWRVRLGILRPNLSLEVQAEAHCPNQPTLWLANRGPRVHHRITVEVWHRCKYWTPHITAGYRNLKGDRPTFGEGDGGTYGHGKFTFDPPAGVQKIGYLDPPEDRKSTWKQESLKWKITMLGITVKEGVTWLPEVPLRLREEGTR